MPIDKTKYPPNWNEISRKIRVERAGNQCEWCGAPNGRYILRDNDDPAKFTVVPDPISQEQFYAIFGGKHITEMSKIIKVILTIAHMDHDTTHNDESNLKALCQRCHLRYDAKEHGKHAAQTRRKKRDAATGQMRLIDDAN